MKKSPVIVVRERFQSKEQLVAAVSSLLNEDLWLDRLNANKGLGRVSNAKLLRLHDRLSAAKQRFGNRDKLVGAILELSQRAKDAGYAGRLKGYPLPRLLDLHASLSRKTKGASAAPPAAAPAKAPAAAKAAAAPAAAEPKAKAKKAPAKSKGAEP